MFPRDDPRCDAGGCLQVVLTECQAPVMPAGIIHMVETHSEPFGSGCQFHPSWTPVDGSQSFST